MCKYIFDAKEKVKFQSQFISQNDAWCKSSPIPKLWHQLKVNFAGLQKKI